jgi:putative tryptophan/tyrosine transport system substrate-binding protein
MRSIQLGRREFITLLSGGVATWPLSARAQQQAMPVIGNVGGTPELNQRVAASLRKGLAELGFVEGQNFRFEFRYTNLQLASIARLIAEFVDQKVTLIVAMTTLQLEAAKAATQSIPIVFSIGSDPVENGFVASLNKPGGNITGVYNLNLMLAGKRLELLRELVPSATKFAFLTNPSELTISDLETRGLQAGAHSLDVNLLIVNARNQGEELEAAFETSIREGAGGMVVGSNALFILSPTQLVALAARYRLPAIYVDDKPVMTGGLISYGADQDDAYRLVGIYAGRILKGEKPADLPVQQSTKTKLLINLKTAKHLGITVPTPLLGRADEVIE